MNIKDMKPGCVIRGSFNPVRDYYYLGIDGVRNANGKLNRVLISLMAKDFEVPFSARFDADFEFDVVDGECPYEYVKASDVKIGDVLVSECIDYHLQHTEVIDIDDSLEFAIEMIMKASCGGESSRMMDKETKLLRKVNQ